MDLNSDGKTVTIKFGRFGGKQINVNIKDIQKLEHEKVLVETYEESMMFPVKVGKHTYYFNGQGHESIKHGELFRAIINGQSIKL